jgi:hypothetical protein
LACCGREGVFGLWVDRGRKALSDAAGGISAVRAPAAGRPAGAIRKELGLYGFEKHQGEE